MSGDLVLVSDRVLLGDGSAPQPGAVRIDTKTGKIVDVVSKEEGLSNPNAKDVGNRVVMPGIVDTHVHVNEPGRTHWEGFATVTRAAARGGITALFDMPLNSIPPTCTVEALDAKLAAAKGQCSVDVGFIGGVIPGNADQIVPLNKRGIKFFKCFLVHSGVDEFPRVTEADLHLAFKEFQKTDATFMFHAEVDVGCCVPDGADVRKYQTFVDSRPPQMETDAIDLVIRMCREYKVPCHIVHLSCADALPAIKAAKEEGLPLTVETCHHYLHFSAEEISEGDTISKCCPPIRSQAHRDALWQALQDDVIDMVVSDHSPSSPDVKQLETGDLMTAWGGIAGVQFGLSATWTGCKARNIPLETLSNWMTTRTSNLAQVDAFKGKLKPGYDADVIVFNPEATWKVETGIIEHKHKLTPYLNRDMYGQVDLSWVRGQCVFDRDGDGVMPPPRGQFVLHGADA